MSPVDPTPFVLPSRALMASNNFLTPRLFNELNQNRKVTLNGERCLILSSSVLLVLT